MIPRRLTNLTMLAIFFSCPTLAATADPGHGAELVRLHVAKASDVLARRLPGNAGHIQVLFERQTPRGLIGLMRLEIERGAVGLDELLRPDMVPEVAYVLQGLTELEVPDSKAKRQLATGDLVYRPNRGTRFGSNGKSRQPVRLLLWALVPLTRSPPSSQCSGRSMVRGNTACQEGRAWPKLRLIRESRPRRSYRWNC
jgi:hypothetical protein